MIQQNEQYNTSPRPVKAVGLLSGGLDSTLAAKVMKDLSIDVHGVYFAMPWGCCDKAMANEAAKRIGIKFIVLQLDERYLEIVKNPKHGYGSAMNPCIDCRIHMFARAGQYMKHIGADFVFTGEVLGQRPMSQMRHSMKAIEKNAGLEGRLLRPLCARFLDPTIPEKEGLVNREKLLDLSGRSRKPQIDLANRLDIKEYNQPAGGCLLTDHNFANRMRDTLDHGYRNFRETIALKWGRHFRITPEFKAVLGRNADENVALTRYAHPDDIIMKFADVQGPTLVLKGSEPDQEVLAKAAGLIQHFSKYKNDEPLSMTYWRHRDPNQTHAIKGSKLDKASVDSIYI